ncbi:threonylcarbamoyl-AMP synthase [Clostridia bacterium]|nr:threonylcarbamoyl-AMP synthase [Clostridia bacterium]
MKTRRLNQDEIDVAAEILLAGGLVAFPTETVYGLGADGLNQTAVKNIYSAKGRPSDNPLILHVSNREMLESIVDEIPLVAEKLMAAFWPGPLTLIFKKSDAVPSEVSASLPTVAVRMPDHPMALKLIERTGRPIAAPSANRSGRPSPTSAEHVLEDLDGHIEAVLMGGCSQVGMESTIVDVSGAVPCLLRPGGLTLEEVRKIAPMIVAGGESAKEEAPRAPGMKYRHYAPDAMVVLLEGEGEQQLDHLETAYRSKQYEAPMALMASQELLESLETRKTDFKLTFFSLGTQQQDKMLGKNVYAYLREADQEGIRTVFVESFKEENMGRTIMNRLKKAAHALEENQ